MQWLARICVDRPVFTWVLVTIPLVLGLVSYNELGVDLFVLGGNKPTSITSAPACKLPARPPRPSAMVQCYEVRSLRGRLTVGGR